jgi:hypothetical protein
MLNVSNLGKLGLSTTDLRTMTSEERQALIREVIRRAQAERAGLVHDVIRRLRSCLGRSRCPGLRPGAPARTTAQHRPAGI